MLHISCNIGTCDLPDMYALRALGPVSLRLWAYISGKSLMSMLQLLHNLSIQVAKMIGTLCVSAAMMEWDKLG